MGGGPYGWERDNEFNDWEGQHDYENDPPDEDEKVCNRCGARGLHWLPVIKPDGRTDYMLHDERNRRHVCKPNINDFDVIPDEDH